MNSSVSVAKTEEINKENVDDHLKLEADTKQEIQSIPVPIEENVFEYYEWMDSY
jgi:hypothetical protein